ncbi:MAG: sugar phosphate nucleotidyltransferase [Chloroherpetonaceae bacterium]|nr:sugar phosphate nucleotidyltransferase [Chloroherpetonaceae bacterium]MCS7211659.1 sugar phosphate nucleotidyltransferase [Chloroherpetonaceae bacterium]MDW8018559.1 sugar phosphate nucleotidyltransferase [Chloroherpetonaceae bacterium]MDW8467341.1 sugar phosphate nucleotidyltransferase [Chloroherpetonaceae bacterium]
MHDLAIVVMAAGKGTRMKSDLAKVLHPLLNRPMIDYVLDAALQLSPKKVVLIVGHQAERVKQATAAFKVEYALQSPQLGTGHAVMQAEPLLSCFNGDVMVLSGDAPLITAATLQKLWAYHCKENAVATVLTAIVEDPTGYGRIIRSHSTSRIVKMVEHKDASPEERAVREINSGVYVFQKKPLFEALRCIRNDNAQQEYYLPDVFNIFLAEDLPVAALTTESPDEICGVNTPEQLQEAEAILRRRVFLPQA